MGGMTALLDSEKGGWYEGNKWVGQRGRDWREIYFAFVRFINETDQTCWKWVLS